MSEKISGGLNTQADLIKYQSIKNKWIYISEEKALEIAVRYYELKRDVKRINKRFRNIYFDEETLKNEYRKRLRHGK